MKQVVSSEQKIASKAATDACCLKTVPALFDLQPRPPHYSLLTTHYF